MHTAVRHCNEHHESCRDRPRIVRTQDVVTEWSCLPLIIHTFPCVLRGHIAGH